MPESLPSAQEPEKKYEIMTSTAVRTDIARLGIPTDYPAFLFWAGVLGRDFFGLSQEEAAQQLRHLHLINDLSPSGVRVARRAVKEMGNTSDHYADVIANRLERFLKGGGDRDILERIAPYARWRQALADNISKQSGLGIDVIKASDFVFGDGEKATDIAEWVNKRIREIMSSIMRKDSVDMEEIHAVIEGRAVNGAVLGDQRSWELLKWRTLPTKLREKQSGESDIQFLQRKVCESVYAWLEGLPAAFFIQGGKERIYASYLGGEEDGAKAGDEGASIARNMKFAVQCATRYQGDLPRELEERFLVHPVLDGIGLRGERKQAHTDPHTFNLDSNNENPDKIVRKLPFFTVHDPAAKNIAGRVRCNIKGRLRPVRALAKRADDPKNDDFLSIAKLRTVGGGIEGPQLQAWRRFAPVLVMSLCDPSGVKISEDGWSAITSRTSDSRAVITSWLIEARKSLSRLDTNKPGNDALQIRPLPFVPAGNPKVAALLVERFARNVAPGREPDADNSEFEIIESSEEDE